MRDVNERLVSDVPFGVATDPRGDSRTVVSSAHRRSFIFEYIPTYGRTHSHDSHDD